MTLKVITLDNAYWSLMIPSSLLNTLQRIFRLAITTKSGSLRETQGPVILAASTTTWVNSDKSLMSPYNDAGKWERWHDQFFTKSTHLFFLFLFVQNKTQAILCSSNNTGRETRLQKKKSPKFGWFCLGLTPLYMSEKGCGFQTTVKYKLEPGAEGLQIAEPCLQQLGLNFNIPFIKYMTITDNQMIDAQFLSLLYCSHIICWLKFGHILKYLACYYKNCNKIKIYCISEGRRNTENCFLI